MELVRKSNPCFHQLLGRWKTFNERLFVYFAVSGTTNRKEEETAVTNVGVTEETTSVLGTRSRTGNDPGGGIDLLAALQLHNTTRQGVTQVPGLVRLKPAYYLQGECCIHTNRFIAGLLFPTRSPTTFPTLHTRTHIFY